MRKEKGITLTESERAYRGTVNRLALSMLVFYGVFSVISGVILVVGLFTDYMPEIAGNVTYELIYAACYAVAFIGPVFFWRIITNKKEHRPMLTEGNLPRETVLYIMAGIAVIYAAAQINALLLEPFSYSSFSEEVIWGTEGTQKNYQIVLAFLVTAVMPGFVEEFLFRGLVLTNLLPYGETTAVVISALLFGVMHQNAGQLLYATAAGLVLGFVYVRTRSIFVCILIHFCNNFLSVLTGVLGERLPAQTAVVLINVMNGAIAATGVVAAVWLIKKGVDRRALVMEKGCFERDLPADPAYAEIALPPAKQVRLFFSPLMIVYLVLCGGQMVLLLFLSLFGGGLL